MVEGDGVNYFSYLHSLAVDRDLDLSDEYLAAEQAGLPVFATLVQTRTPTGLVADFQPVGAALLAMPLYLTALALHPSGTPQFGAGFVAAFTIASLLYGLLAVALCYRLAAEATGSPRAAALGSLTAAAATPFVYYLLWEPSYAHTFSACLASAFLLLWWRSRGRAAAGGWLGMGVVAGLMAAVRYQDGALAAIVLLDLGRARWRLLAFAAGAAAGFSPQLFVTHAIFGSWLPYRPPEFALQPWPGHYLEVLLSTHNGLLAWTPACIAAAAGFRFLGDRRLALAAVTAFCLELAIEGAAPDWWGGHSFGMRRFLVLMPFAAVGLAALTAGLPSRSGLLVGAAVLLIAWNLILVANFEYVIRTDRDPGLAGLAEGQVQALRWLPRLFGQGGAVRALVLWAPLHRPFQPALGLGLVGLEAACLAIAAWAAGLRTAVRPGH